MGLMQPKSSPCFGYLQCLMLEVQAALAGQAWQVRTSGNPQQTKAIPNMGPYLLTALVVWLPLSWAAALVAWFSGQRGLAMRLIASLHGAAALALTLAWASDPVRTTHVGGVATTLVLMTLAASCLAAARPDSPLQRPCFWLGNLAGIGLAAGAAYLAFWFKIF